MSANQLIVGVGADISSIPTTLADAEKLFLNFANTVKNDITASFSSMFKDAKLADSLGASTEQMRELKYVSDLTGTSFSALTSSMSFFERNVGKAIEDTTTKAKTFHSSLHTSTHLSNIMTASVDGTTNALRKFTALGLDPKKLASEGTALAIRDVAIAVEKLGTTAQRNAAYSDILGRGFKGAIPALQEIALRGDAAAAELHKLSGEFTRVDYSHIELAKESMVKLETIYDAFIKQIAVQFSPLITIATDWLIEMGITGENSGEIIGNAFKTMISWAESFIGMIESIPSLISSVWEMIKEDAPGTFDTIGTTIKETLTKAIDDVATYMTKKFDDTFKGSSLYKEYQAIKDKVKSVTDAASSLPSVGPSYFGEYGPWGLAQKAAGALGRAANFDMDRYFQGENFGLSKRVQDTYAKYPALGLPINVQSATQGGFVNQIVSESGAVRPPKPPSDFDTTMPLPIEQIKSPIDKLRELFEKFKQDQEENRRRIKADWDARLAKEKADAEARSKKRNQELSDMKETNKPTAPLGFGGRIDQYGGSIYAITSSLQRGGSNVQQVQDVQGNKLLQGIYEKSNMVARIGR